MANPNSTISIGGGGGGEMVSNHQISSVLNSAAEAGEDDVVETDPSGRFERYRKSLGKGAYKEVFKAFDQEEGVEVAWNQIRITSLTKPDITRIHTEIQILQSLRNENIINLLYSWRAPSSTPSADKDDIFFITEFMSSGSLKGYIRRTKGLIKPKIIRNWCKQILNGLHYLHTRENPIIHRDLKCENIFINGNNGQAKIGDLGLAVVKATQHLSSVLGTPEFMAPELYDEFYDEKVDIYAFGMVVLEIATKEYPYSECTNQAQIYRKVTTGVKPAALAQVADDEIRAFIDICIEHDPKKRPSATELLNHPFFNSANMLPNGGGSFVDLTSLDLLSPSSGSFPGTAPTTSQQQPQQQPIQTPLQKQEPAQLLQQSHQSQSQTLLNPPRNPSTHEVESDQHLFSISRHSTPLKATVTCDIEAIGPVNEDDVTLKMVYHTGTSSCEIKFPFNLTDDTATDVVSELVKENLILAIDEQLTRRRIEEAVRGLLIKQRQGQKTFSEASISFKYDENTLMGGLPSAPIPVPSSTLSGAHSNESPITEGVPQMVPSATASASPVTLLSDLAEPSTAATLFSEFVPNSTASASMDTPGGGGAVGSGAERKFSAPAAMSIPISSSSIPTIHAPILSTSIDEALLKSVEYHRVSPHPTPSLSVDSALERQKQVSEKLKELEEYNLKNFDASHARPKSNS